MGNYHLRAETYDTKDENYFNFRIFKGAAGFGKEVCEGHINCSNGYEEGMHVTLQPSEEFGVDRKTNFFFEFEQSGDTIQIIPVTPKGFASAKAKKSKKLPETSQSIDGLPGGIRTGMKDFLVYLCRP